MGRVARTLAAATERAAVDREAAADRAPRAARVDRAPPAVPVDLAAAGPPGVVEALARRVARAGVAVAAQDPEELEGDAVARVGLVARVAPVAPVAGAAERREPAAAGATAGDPRHGVT